MKTYKDGLLEAAKVAENTVCDVHLPTGVKIYGQVAARVIRALAAQEDQRSEAERIADSRSKSSTQSSDHHTTADDLLRDARLSLDPFEYPELCQRIDAAIKGSAT